MLVRARKSVAVFDAPSPARNAASHGVHNFIGVEGMLPADLARTAWEQIDAVGGASLRREEVATIERDHEGELVLTTTEGDRLGAHHVILAFGHRDAIPDIPGFAECWGDTVISCPFCDGYEHRDRVWGLVVPSTGAKATPPLFAYNWTDKVKVFLGSGVDLPTELASALEAQGLELHRGDITAINHDAARSPASRSRAARPSPSRRSSGARNPSPRPSSSGSPVASGSPWTRRGSSPSAPCSRRTSRASGRRATPPARRWRWTPPAPAAPSRC